jgi:hypothetical protein
MNLEHLLELVANDPDDDTLSPSDLRWKICVYCAGDGVLRGYAGVYTSDDFAEDGPDALEDYLNHRRQCEHCEGTGKVRGLDDDVWARPDVQKMIDDYYHDRAVEAQERRMGA